MNVDNVECGFENFGCGFWVPSKNVLVVLLLFLGGFTVHSSRVTRTTTFIIPVLFSNVYTRYIVRFFCTRKSQSSVLLRVNV